MKILFLIDSLGTGGAEKSMVELAKYLNRLGHSITFLCLDQREVSYEDEVKLNGLELYFFKNQNFLSRVSFLRKFIRLNNFDLVHSVLLRSNLLLRATKFFLKDLITVQSLVNTSYSKKRKIDNNLPWYKYQMVKNVDKYSARIFPSFYHIISRTVFLHYKKLYKINNNYKIIYRGREENMYPNKSLNNSFILINVGRQEFAKGQLVLLKSLVYLREKYGRLPIKLLIFGYEGKASDSIKRFIYENELSDQVEVLGFVRNVEKELMSADAFVFSSLYEGLGGALLEAFAARLPCICTELSVFREVVGESNCVLFCKPGDYKQFAENIFLLYKNVPLRQELGKKAHLRFMENFQLDSINRDMTQMYEEILSC